MYGILTYIWLFFMANVGKYTRHGSYGNIVAWLCGRKSDCPWMLQECFRLIDSDDVPNVNHQSLTVCPWKMMVRRRSFPIGFRELFRDELLNFRGGMPSCLKNLNSMERHNFKLISSPEFTNKKNIQLLRWYNQFIAWFFFVGNMIFVEWHLGGFFSDNLYNLYVRSGLYSPYFHIINRGWSSTQVRRGL